MHETEKSVKKLLKYEGMKYYQDGRYFFKRIQRIVEESTKQEVRDVYPISKEITLTAISYSGIGTEQK